MKQTDRQTDRRGE